ncbi:MAG: L-threonine 3-dehydrogenase [Actinomycetota bacterium]
MNAQKPITGEQDVKIRTLRTGICGTDLHIESWDHWAASTIKAPIIPGHEFYGEVVEIGSHVRDVKVGARVSGEGHIVCGTCRNCRAGRRQMCIRTSSVGVNRDGAFAEYVVIPESNVWVHHNDVDPDIGAIFDPFGNAVHTALSFPLVGEDVLITGAGPIGLIAAAIARHIGARFIVITDISEPRLALARKMGADLAINVSNTKVSETQKTLGMTEGFDVGFEMSGHASALPEMINNLNHGGRVAMLGLPTESIELDWAKVVTHMITIKGIYGREMFESWVCNERHASIKSSVTKCAFNGNNRSIFSAALGRRICCCTSRTGGKVVLNWENIHV